jgi:hypothetical protein
VHLYLDSRDLIELVEKRSPEETARFETRMRQSGSQLIFSMHNITECCAPLVHGGEGSSVMKTLNRLEDLPHVYMAEARIDELELREAASAFLVSRDYRSIGLPVVPRFDYVVSAFRDVPTKQYLNYNLAHVVFELWGIDKSLLAGYPDHGRRFKELLKSDRARSDYKNHEANFQNMVARNLQLYRIAFPSERVTPLSDWILEDVTRCPAVRLGYEVFHKILRNLTDSGKESDIPDFAHLSCVPYCDAITLDNRMRGYVAQVDHSIQTDHSRKIFRNIDDVDAMLEPTAV